MEQLSFLTLLGPTAQGSGGVQQPEMATQPSHVHTFDLLDRRNALLLEREYVAECYTHSIGMPHYLHEDCFRATCRLMSLWCRRLSPVLRAMSAQNDMYDAAIQSRVAASLSVPERRRAVQWGMWKKFMGPPHFHEVSMYMTDEEHLLSGPSFGLSRGNFPQS